MMMKKIIGAGLAALLIGGIAIHGTRSASAREEVIDVDDEEACKAKGGFWVPGGGEELQSSEETARLGEGGAESLSAGDVKGEVVGEGEGGPVRGDEPGEGGGTCYTERMPATTSH